MIDRMMYWYSESQFPTDRFDDISPVPKQVKTKAMSPLCHTSVSKWTLAAGAKVTGEVVYVVVDHLNQYFDGKWKPAKWTPSKETAHCVGCHGPDDIWHSTDGMNHRQGHWSVCFVTRTTRRCLQSKVTRA